MVFIAVMVELSSLHFCPLTEFILAHTAFLEQFVQLDADFAIASHLTPTFL